MPDVKVSQIMSKKIHTLERNQTLGLAQDIMSQARIRHFAVLDGDTLVGVLSQRDLFHATLGSVMNYGESSERAHLAAITVKEVMSEPAVFIGPDALLAEAARRMVEKRIGCLPVLEKGKLVGMLTETDVLRHVAGQ